MNKLQVTLTVEESKEIISLGLMKHKTFVNSLERGKILLKGGTTVSKISEKLINYPLRICGRITSRGTVSSKNLVDGHHSIVYSKGNGDNVDENLVEVVQEFSKNDLIICGANAIDYKGNAATMIGSSDGGSIGQILNSLNDGETNIIIPVGLEKMIFGDLDEIIGKSSRNGKTISWGMAVGLMPLKGEVFTEIEAIKQLADVDCFQIGAGGLGNAQGSVTLEIWSDSNEEFDKIFKILKEIKSFNTKISGIKDSLIECEPICDSCKNHKGCGYKSKLF